MLGPPPGMDGKGGPPGAAKGEARDAGKPGAAPTK
jgi:hypothetical protein